MDASLSRQAVSFTRTSASRESTPEFRGHLRLGYIGIGDLLVSVNFFVAKRM
jgi:hypothetical protein